MAALLVGLSIMAVMMTVAMPVWKQMAQRERETELVFRGLQYARAVGLYGRKYANANPPSLDVLVQQRFLRRKYKDPITNDDFLLLYAGQTGTIAPGGISPAPGQQSGRAGAGGGSPTTQTGQPPGTSSITFAPGGATGGIVGVASKSKAGSIRIYNGRTHYNEWVFTYTQATQTPGAGGGGVQAPGQQGRGGNPNNPGGNRGGNPNGPNGPGRGNNGPNGPNGPGGRQGNPGGFQGANPFATPVQPFVPTPGRGR